MPDTPLKASSFRHACGVVPTMALLALIIGVVFRVLAVRGDLWLDELWSLVQVSEVDSAIEIITRLKHDNNHLVNSAWMWLVGEHAAPYVYRLPSLLCALLSLVLIWREARRSENRLLYLVWLTLLATSYPLTLYGTEARGYALTMLATIISFLCLTRLLKNPKDLPVIIAFGVAGIVGCTSHAIFALFLAPAIAWLGWMFVTSSMSVNVRGILRLGVVPPVITACVLTYTFYKGMVIGGAPLLPYLEVAATTISVSFGGEALSSTNPSVTGWSLFLSLVVVAICVIESIAWLRSGDPVAILVALIMVTPWVAVMIFQPHFILARYFLIQMVFSYLLLARFLMRLASQGKLGSAIAAVALVGFMSRNVLHSYELVSLERSRFPEIISLLSSESDEEPVTVGGDQDYQNSLRLRYARLRDPRSINFTYLHGYAGLSVSPRFIIRESLDAYEEFPTTWTAPQGARYRLRRTFKAPQLNGSHLYLYEIADPTL